MSFIERFIILRPYLGESTIGGPTVFVCTVCTYCMYCMYILLYVLYVHIVCIVCTYCIYCVYIPCGSVVHIVSCAISKFPCGLISELKMYYDPMF